MASVVVRWSDNWKKGKLVISWSEKVLTNDTTDYFPAEVPPELTHNLVLDETTVHSLPHVAICLLGNFKGEGGELSHHKCSK